MAGRPSGAAVPGIAIAPFAIRFEGALFGLVLGEDEEEDEEADRVWAELNPG
ncbi:hypothetical protein [Streptomyces sp. NPDC059949]|uniref:hypothetical protein n=1 Tax=Streptomyces sp. NPDC059949 TaxID=3347013 RepID=UPI00364E557E